MMDFYNGKNIFITGHTGFKGSWLCQILNDVGANVSGYSLSPSVDENLFEIINIKDKVNSFFGDIRDIDKLKTFFDEVNPEIVIHMAAQPLVRESYINPVYTYETNVMGTVNILECLRDSNVKSFLNVTTDKVYENKEWVWPYRENETLCGYDPYSNSKSCSELVTFSYKNSFFRDVDDIAISTARSGNVIGGGDFSKDRIIPDCVESAKIKEEIRVRNPNSVRPYQHVLECLHGYLLLVQKQYSNNDFEGSYNFGPDEENSVSTGELVTKFCEKWGENISWTSTLNNGPHESNFLKLDSSKAKSILGWKPRWNIEIALEKVVEWTKDFFNEKNVIECMNNQINEYFGDNFNYSDL